MPDIPAETETTIDVEVLGVETEDEARQLLKVKLESRFAHLRITNGAGQPLEELVASVTVVGPVELIKRLGLADTGRTVLLTLEALPGEERNP